MAKYSISGAGPSGTNITILALIGGTTRRPRLYEVGLGFTSTPADTALDWALMRLTAVGTEGSGFTPVALDPADPAAAADGAMAHSVEPTYTANSHLVREGVNQRGKARWMANAGSELIIPATANNGIGLRSLAMSTGTPTVAGYMLFEE